MDKLIFKLLKINLDLNIPKIEFPLNVGIRK
jgi:hypothetical protein